MHPAGDGISMGISMYAKQLCNVQHLASIAFNNTKYQQVISWN